ncbi:MAG: hypothetical protein QXT33_00290 [Thermofilum sp.]|uniref:Uncharacterized protein n=1 Tax=Thermofilum pendens TaxID=2269 RepID=A0A7C4H9K4_THEPE
MVSVQELSEVMKRYMQDISLSIDRGNYDEAIDLAMKTLEVLLSVAQNDVVANLADANVRKIAADFLVNYEKTLSYARGVKEGLRYMSPIYQPGEKLQLLQVLSSAVSELFSFIMGALLVVASLTGPAEKREEVRMVV